MKNIHLSFSVTPLLPFPYRVRRLYRMYVLYVRESRAYCYRWVMAMTMAVRSRCAIKWTTIKINWTIFQLIDDFCLLSIRSKLTNFMRITLTSIFHSSRCTLHHQIILSFRFVSFRCFGISSLALHFSFSRFSETITVYLSSNGAESCNGCNL